MREKYSFKVNFDAKQYIGIHLNWDYVKRKLRCSMKGYVKQALTELKHILSSNRHQSAPSTMRRPDYGAKVQYAYNDNGVPVEEKRIRRIQSAIGKFLYYGCAINISQLYHKTSSRRPPSQSTNYFLICQR